MSGEKLARVAISRGQTVGGVADPAAETYDEVKNATNCDGPGGSKEKVEVTNLKSRTKEYIGGISDVGDVTFDINYDFADAIHEAMRDEVTRSERRNWKIEWLDGDDTVLETAYVLAELTEFPRSSQINTAIAHSCAITLSSLAWA